MHYERMDQSASPCRIVCVWKCAMVVSWCGMLTHLTYEHDDKCVSWAYASLGILGTGQILWFVFMVYLTRLITIRTAVDLVWCKQRVGHAHTFLFMLSFIATFLNTLDGVVLIMRLMHEPLPIGFQLTPPLGILLVNVWGLGNLSIVEPLMRDAPAWQW